MKGRTGTRSIARDQTQLAAWRAPEEAAWRGGGSVACLTVWNATEFVANLAMISAGDTARRNTFACIAQALTRAREDQA